MSSLLVARIYNINLSSQINNFTSLMDTTKRLGNVLSRAGHGNNGRLLTIGKSIFIILTL
jgi:hypothetical protein